MVSANQASTHHTLIVIIHKAFLGMDGTVELYAREWNQVSNNFDPTLSLSTAC